jgi:hypothetical protein
MMIVWTINGFYVPIDRNRFGFHRMDNELKDELVLSVVYS